MENFKVLCLMSQMHNSILFHQCLWQSIFRNLIYNVSDAFWWIESYSSRGTSVICECLWSKIILAALCLSCFQPHSSYFLPQLLVFTSCHHSETAKESNFHEDNVKCSSSLKNMTLRPPMPFLYTEARAECHHHHSLLQRMHENICWNIFTNEHYVIFCRLEAIWVTWGSQDGGNKSFQSLFTKV